MAQYSGKSVRDVPEEELYVGMRVISALGNPGTVIALHPDDRYFSLDIVWDNGKESLGSFHNWLDKVKVA